MTDDQKENNDLSLDEDIVEGDFADSDAEAAPTDEEFDDEAWDDSYDEEPMGDSPAIEPPAKKKSSNGLIIGITVVIALGVFVMQLAGGGGKKNDANNNTPAPVTAQAPAAPAPELAPPVPAAPEPEGGAFADPAALDRLVKNKSGNEVDVIPPMPMPIQSSPTAQGADIAQEPLTPLPQDIPVTPVSGLPPPEMPMMPRSPDADMTTEAKIETPAPSAGLPAAKDVLTGRTDATPLTPPAVAVAPDVGAKLDQLFTRLDQIEKKVGEQPAPVSGGTPVDADTAKQIKDLKDTIAKLNDRIAGMEAQTRIVAEKAEEAVSATKSAPAAAPVADAPPPVKKKAPVKKAKPAPKKETAEKAEATPVSTAWTLKGAMPGKAMLSKPGQSEVFTVGVGDNLSGLGRVTGVYIDNGKWVVETTGGRVVQ